MYQVFGKKAVVSQIVNYKLIRWKIIAVVACFYNFMYRLNQHRFTSVILYSAFPQVPHRAYGKNNLQLRVELRQLLKQLL